MKPVLTHLFLMRLLTSMAMTIRADRNRMGEVFTCMYAGCNINYQKRPDLVPNDLEAISLEIKQANIQSFIISTIYRPP